MQNALVTAVIPTRNRPGLLKRAITSVRAQTYDSTISTAARAMLCRSNSTHVSAHVE